MDDQARHFRELVAEQNRGQVRKRRFGPELRRLAVRYVRAARSSGQGWREISESLGVAANLLQRWCSSRSAIVRVEVDETRGSERDLRLRTPDGYEILGLDTRSAAELLRQLR